MVSARWTGEWLVMKANSTLKASKHPGRKRLVPSSQTQIFLKGRAHLGRVATYTKDAEPPIFQSIPPASSSEHSVEPMPLEAD